MAQLKVRPGGCGPDNLFVILIPQAVSANMYKITDWMSEEEEEEE